MVGEDFAQEDWALARGTLEAPAWTVLLVGTVVVLAGVLYFVRRAQSLRRRPRVSTRPMKRA